MELQEAILKRRSVRKFTEDAVTDEELRQIFESVRWSPSWANTQAWEFIVVRDKTLIEKITGTYADKNPATKCSLAASVLIVACANTSVYGFYDSKDATATKSWYMFDLGLAVQTLCLKAHELGLGTVVVGLMNQEACKKILTVRSRSCGCHSCWQACFAPKRRSAAQSGIGDSLLEYIRQENVLRRRQL